MLTETFLRYGQPQPPPKLIPLRAGPLSLLYDPANGMVRRIKLGEVEVLRGIYAAVRDRNWGTVPGIMREVSRSIEPRSFHIEFQSNHQQDQVDFTWRGIVRGDANGFLSYEFDGIAKTTFLRNRIGFCVLHPIRECAGVPARQFRVDGSKLECRFPSLIEPQIFGRSSFQQLRGIAHDVAPGVSAELEFNGDTFEMEDQRNWTDASFKTYCTPLALPFPVEVKVGTRICQAVTLKLTGDSAEPGASPIELTSSPEEEIRLAVPNAPTGRLPSIGLGVASHGEPLTEAEITTLGQLGLSHLRVDVRLAAGESVVALGRAVREAEQLNARLELALHLPRGGETDPGDLLRILRKQALPVKRILALREGEPATSLATLARVRQHFDALGVPIGAGSDCNFCELNREHAGGRLPVEEADFLFWAINPQVHAFDHLSLMETLEAQTATVVSARAFSATHPLVISPVTLRQRFNPVATGTEPPLPPNQLPPQVDPRQLSHFAGAWTLGSIAALASAGVDSVTYYETAGWRGVMESAAGSSLPDKFPSNPGCPFPVFHALSHFAGCDHVAEATCSRPHIVAGLALFANNRLRRVLVANLTDVHQIALVAWPGGKSSQLELKPYEVASLSGD